MSASGSLVSLEDIRAARAVHGDRLHRTPMFRSTTLGSWVDADLYVKAELFQKTGSFKVRGVLNRLHNLPDEEKQKGVISLSAGNHAQAVAWAASAIGISSTIIMPANAVQSKIDATRGYGGEVVLTDENLLAVTRRIQAERGLTLIHPFDDPYIIAGHGTAGLELMEDLPDVDVVICGIGGGGIISGLAAAVKQIKPDVHVIGVEPEGAPGMTLSLAQGSAATLSSINTIADGLAAPFVGALNLAHVQAFVDEVVLIDDESIKVAMRHLLERTKLLVEPAGAAGTAALLSGKIKVPAGAKVCCFLSGGNIGATALARLMSES
ncbi:MAG: pyridoxal-phosphate dependent enzyme [Anaerolineales bacterium]|nr:pyridoxal-phosphate dependent enzyme [Anaerolineales bacterium]